LPSVSRSESQQPEKDLRCDESVATCRVPIVRNNFKNLAEGVQCEPADWRTAYKGTIFLKVQRQGQRIDAAV